MDMSSAISISPKYFWLMVTLHLHSTIEKGIITKCLLMDLLYPMLLPCSNILPRIPLGSVVWSPMVMYCAILAMDNIPSPFLLFLIMGPLQSLGRFLRYLPNMLNGSVFFCILIVVVSSFMSNFDPIWDKK